MSLNNNLDKCVIITTTRKEYRNLLDVPEKEYSNVHTIQDINPKLIKTNNENFLKIAGFTNLRFMSCDYDNWSELVWENILDNIAHFRKLSILGIIDYNKYSFVPHNTGSFIWENNMTIFNPNDAKLQNIPEHIEYLNIINDAEHDYVDIPDTIKHLHVCIQKINNYKQTNLPVQLKSITITIPKMYERHSKNELYSIIKFNTKIPFECELIIDDVFI